MNAPGPVPSSSESTELERRVLANERVLQSLIAYMSKTEPRFVDHLRNRFVEPMKMVRHEHDSRDTDHDAEAFIAAIMRLEDTGKPASSDERTHDTPEMAPVAVRIRPGRPTPPPDRIRLKKTGGIWHVTVDGAFWGDFHKKERALAAMALAKLSSR